MRFFAGARRALVSAPEPYEIEPRTAGNALVRPNPRQKWLATTKSAYAAYWRDQASSLITPAAAILVHRYFELLDQWQRTLRRVEKKPEVEGSMGQPRMNPSSGFLMQLEDRLQKLESELAISPASRSRLKFEAVSTEETLDRLLRRARKEG